jgi:LysR family glycine cleavage system transcriptional activator
MLSTKASRHKRNRLPYSLELVNSQPWLSPSPSPVKLPPLNALRAFDSVARLGGVRLAAQALHVTPAAVTQQVKLLERSLGVALLRREGRGIELTDAGHRLHAGTARHLRAIAHAADELRPQGRRVRVSTVPSFAVRWLVPRLKHFTALHPEVQIEVGADPRVVNLDDGEYDLAIREGLGRNPGTETRLLWPLHVLPVCTPGYLRRVFGRVPARGWPKARLLHEVDHAWWAPWLDQAGISGVDVASGLHFSHTVMAITAALDEQGVALVPRIFVEEELADGRLVAVDAQVYVTGIGMYLAWSVARAEKLSAAALLFREWLLAEGTAAGAESAAANEAAAAPPRVRSPRPGRKASRSG